MHFSVFSRINNPWFYSRISVGYNFKIFQEDIFKTESKFEESYIFNSETQYAIIWYRRNIYTSRHKNTNCHLSQKISFITNKQTNKTKQVSVRIPLSLRQRKMFPSTYEVPSLHEMSSVWPISNLSHCLSLTMLVLDSRALSAKTSCTEEESQFDKTWWPNLHIYKRCVRR